MPDQEADEFIVSDPELITRVRTGDREAFGELYKRHSGAATTLSRQFARTATESDDLVSESFARVLDNLLAGKGPDTAFRAYLFTTIRNTAYDRTRKDKRLQFTDDMTTHDIAVAGDDPVLAKMESGLIATAFAQLPERWQAVLWHTQVEGETPAQVGALLGMAPGAVSSLAFRAREGLREAYLQAHLAETAAEQCRATVERLGAWTRGGLSKREKTQVDAHLETCERCRALAAELQEVNHGLRGLLAPLLLGGAAAGYLATLGPVAPLAAPGTLIAGAGSTGAGTTGTGTAGSGSAGSGAGGSGGGGAGGSGAAGAGGSGGAGAGVAGGAGAAGGAGVGSAATAAGVAAAAAAVAAGAIGVAALASAGESGGATAAAAGTSAAGTSAAGAGAGGSGVAGVSGAGGGAAGISGAGSGAAGAGTAGGAGAAGTGAAGAGAAGTGAAGAGAAGAGGIFAGLGVGGLVAAGAALVVAAVAAVVFIVSINSPDTTNTAGQDVATSDAAPAGGTGAENEPGAAGGISPAGPGGTTGAVPGGTAGTDAPIVPGGNPGTTDGTTGAVVPIVDSTPQTTPPVDDETDNPATTDTDTDTGTGTGTQPSSADPTATEPTATEPTPTEPTPTEPTATEPTATEPTPTGPTITDPPTTDLPTTDPPTTDPPTTDPPVPTADLTITFPTVVAPLNAGASGTVSMTLTNNGDGASTVQSADLVLPTGVQVTNVEAGTPVPALRRASMGLLRAGPCLSAPSTNCTIDLPAVPAHHKVTVTLTLAVDSTVTGGDLTITVLGKPFTITLTINTPAALSLGALEVTQDLYAGGTGQLSVRVANTGEQPSIGQPINVDHLPNGVTVSAITGDVTCQADPPVNALAVITPVCTLLAVNPDDSATVVIDLDVQPSATSSSETATTVAIGDNPNVASRLLTVTKGIASLDTAPAGPFTAGRPATLTVTPVLQGTATTTGPILVTSADASVAFGPSSGCDPITGTNAVSCAGSLFSLDIVIPVDHAAGPLSITATDAGGRSLQFPNVTFEIVAAAPSNLVVTGLTTSRTLIAGGTGQLTVQVNNAGALPSADELIDVDLPAGITVTDITQSGGTGADRSLCSSAVPELRPQVAAAAEPTCTLPSMAADRDVTLLIELAVAPSAGKESAEATVTIGAGTRNSSATNVVVQAGITGLDTTPAGPFTAGQPLQLTVTPQVPDGVTAGEVTVASGDPAVTFGSTSDCDPVPGGNAVICNRDSPVGATRSFTVPVNIPVTHPAGELQLTASDAGGRPLSYTSAPLMIVAATPANLVVTDLAVSADLIAGGTGQLTVKVQNTGALDSAEETIDVVLPNGLTVTSIAAGDTQLCTSGEGSLTCKLPPLAAGESRTLVISLAVPSTTEAEPGTAIVTIGDGTDPSESVELTVNSGISALSTTATNPLYTGTTTILPIDVESTVEEPGPITFLATGTGVTFNKSAGCDAPSGTSTIVCSGESIGLSITISAQQSAGDLPVLVTDAGGRELQLNDAAGNTFRIEAAKASLRVEKLGIATPLLAGGTGALTVQVSNIGGQPARAQSIEVDLPSGVALSNMTVGGSSICTPVVAGTPTCSLPEIDPDESITAILNLTVQPSVVAQPGDATVIVPGDDVSISLEVDSGISSLVAAQRGPLTAGSTVELAVTPQLLDDVTASGPVTLTATAGVTFGESSDCTPAGGGTTITCEGDEFTITVIIPAGQSAGLLPVEATDAGQRTVNLLDADFDPFSVVAATHLTLSDLDVFQEPGATGVLYLTVTNNTKTASTSMPIYIDLPKGFTANTVVAISGPVLAIDICRQSLCYLGPLEPKAYTALIITVQPGKQPQSGTVTVTIDGVERTGRLTGGLGLDLDLFATSDPTGTSAPNTTEPNTTVPGPGPFFEPDPGAAFGNPPPTPSTDLSAAADATAEAAQPDSPPTDTTQPGSTQPGTAAAETTQPPAPSTEQDPTGTEPSAPVESSGSESGAADPGPEPGTASPTPVTTETAVPPTETSPATETSPEASGVDEQPTDPPAEPPPPAAIVFTEPTGDDVLTAGGTGSLTFVATNEGGVRSASTGFDISLPTGISVQGIRVNGTTICDGPFCQLPELEPGESAVVSVIVAAGPNAETGGARVGIDGDGVGWMLRIQSLPAALLPTAAVDPRALLPTDIGTFEIGEPVTPGN